MTSIAVIGASTDRAKFGNKCVRAYIQKGWTVYPINPKSSEIEKLKCYKSVNELPETPDFVSLYLPPLLSLSVLDEIAGKGIKNVYFNPGTFDETVLEKARKLGLNALVECSILAIGLHPELFP